MPPSEIVNPKRLVQLSLFSPVNITSTSTVYSLKYLGIVVIRFSILGTISEPISKCSVFAEYFYHLKIKAENSTRESYMKKSDQTYDLHEDVFSTKFRIRALGVGYHESDAQTSTL